MGLEIERRFLVEGQEWNTHSRWQRRLRQGYLAATAAGFTVRVRISANSQAWITLKADAAGIARHEFEYPIPLGDAEALLTLAPHQLSKVRHGLDLPGGDWVVDVFEADNEPLVLAEVELEWADQPLEVPLWCGAEITGLAELSNAALAVRPFGAWTEAERQALP
jgi:CYTH domain-containing protein